MELQRMLFASVLVAALCRPVPGWSQGVCRAADSTSAELIAEVARYSAATHAGDIAVRDSLRLPAVPANQVVLVTQDPVCKKANVAYQADRAITGGSGFSGRVYVVKIGTTYAVLDPSFSYGRPDNWTVVIMDSRYRTLSVF